MKNTPLRQPDRDHGTGTRLVTLMVAGAVVLVLLPWAFIRLGGGIDSRAGLAPLLYPPYNWILGGALGVAGGLFGLWSVYVQVDRGRGTPVPLVPTQRLLVDGPYRYCRNPMTLGIIGLYKGIAIVSGSYGTMALIIAFFVALLFYILLIEEKELAARFGAEYEAYKKRTAYLIPGIW